MQYEPQDIKKVINTVIALDVAFGALLEMINKHDPKLSATVAKTLEDSADTAYALSHVDHAAGIADKISGWARILTTRPTPAGRH